MKDYKRVPVKHLDNCRDLGGYACQNGGFFRYHKLYRSDAPCRLSEEEWEFIRNMGVRTVLDLRSVSEQRDMPYKVPEGITRIPIPLMKEDVPIGKEASGKENALSAFGKSMEESYYHIVKDSPERLTSALQAVAQGLKQGAVLFHCSVGKDRTGILAAMIYLICGVDERDIVADYQVTETYLSHNQMICRLPESRKVFAKSDPNTMLRFLEKIKTEKLFDTLSASGLTEKDREIIQKKCVEY